MAEEEEDMPLVIDKGSGTIKAGFGGDDLPKIKLPTVLGRPKYEMSCTGYNHNIIKTTDGYMGDELKAKGKLLKLFTSPIEHGIVTDWDDMERMWHHVFYYDLRVPPEEHPVLLTEAPLNPKANRERMTQIMFDSFNVPAMYVNLSSVFALYASGRTNGVVIGSGHDVSHSVPIYEGYALTNSIRQSEFGGKDLTEDLRLRLNERGYSFVSREDIEIVNAIKEKLCFVSQDFQQDTKSGLESAALEKCYKLPDESILTLGNERFQCPEMLFSSNVGGNDKMGLQHLLQESFLECDKEVRPELYKSTLLSGGSTMFPGFGQRLKNELSHSLNDSRDINVVNSPDVDNDNLAWIGGSILASLPSFQQMWITKAEYDECGPAIVHRKCF